MPPIKFRLNPSHGLGGDDKNFKMVAVGYQNVTILSILNLRVSQMPPTMFQFNPTFCSGADVVLKLSRWPPWWPSWISEQNDFSNSESPCRHVAPMPPIKFGFNLTNRSGADGTILAILNLHVRPMLPIKFGLNLTNRSGADGTILAILNFHVRPVLPVKFGLNLINRLGADGTILSILIHVAPMPPTMFGLNPT